MDFMEAFTVVVGDEEQHYVLHKCMATTSDFFAAALNGSWKESKGERNQSWIPANLTDSIRELENLIKLPDHTGEHFNSYLQWVYTGKIQVVSSLQCSGIATERQFLSF